MSLSLSGKSSAPAVSVAVLLIAMLSLQGGASLAKSLFPAVGATGITALRLGLGTLMLCVIFKPWRLRFTREQRLPLLLYGLALGCMNFLFYLSLRTVPLGVAVALLFLPQFTSNKWVFLGIVAVAALWWAPGLRSRLRSGDAGAGYAKTHQL